MNYEISVKLVCNVITINLVINNNVINFACFTSLDNKSLILMKNVFRSNFAGKFMQFQDTLVKMISNLCVNLFVYAFA